MGVTCMASNVIGYYCCCRQEEYQGNLIFKSINTDLVLEGGNITEEDKKTFDTFEIADKGVLNQFRYLMDVEGFPVYQETDIEFYGEASEAYSKLIEDVEGAHSFIYLEYFAVQCSTAFMKLGIAVLTYLALIFFITSM